MKLTKAQTEMLIAGWRSEVAGGFAVRCGKWQQVCYRLKNRGLLKFAGRHRDHSIYFFRITKAGRAALRAAEQVKG